MSVTRCDCGPRVRVIGWASGRVRSGRFGMERLRGWNGEGLSRKPGGRARTAAVAQACEAIAQDVLQTYHLTVEGFLL